MIIYLAAIDAPEDRDTFVALYETYRNLMFHVAHKILRNEADAEDAVHDAFVTVAEKIQIFSSLERHKTRSLLVTIVEHKAIDLYRKKQRRGEAPLVEEISGIDPGPQGKSGEESLLAAPQVVRQCGAGQIRSTQRDAPPLYK